MKQLKLFVKNSKRIVIDTNIIASAIFFGGKPKTLIDLLLKQKICSYVTLEIIEEYQKTINYLFDKYNKEPIVCLDHIISASNIIDSTSKYEICRDHDDDKFINCAIDSKAMYIVSGDNDLLDIKKYKNIEILTVSDFLDRYYK